MATTPDRTPNATRRADAERNRAKILGTARAAFAEPGDRISMAEISRRAGVAIATLYRNFPGRRELLEQTDRDNPVFDSSRARVLAAGRPLLAAAQASREVRDELTLEQVLDMVIAVSAIRGDADYRDPILQAALDGIRRPTT